MMEISDYMLTHHQEDPDLLRGGCRHTCCFPEEHGFLFQLSLLLGEHGTNLHLQSPDGFETFLCCQFGESWQMTVEVRAEASITFSAARNLNLEETFWPRP